MRDRQGRRSGRVWRLFSKCGLLPDSGNFRPQIGHLKRRFLVLTPFWSSRVWQILFCQTLQLSNSSVVYLDTVLEVSGQEEGQGRRWRDGDEGVEDPTAAGEPSKFPNRKYQQEPPWPCTLVDDEGDNNGVVTLQPYRAHKGMLTHPCNLHHPQRRAHADGLPVLYEMSTASLSWQWCTH